MGGFRALLPADAALPRHGTRPRPPPLRALREGANGLKRFDLAHTSKELLSRSDAVVSARAADLGRWDYCRRHQETPVAAADQRRVRRICRSAQAQFTPGRRHCDALTMALWPAATFSVGLGIGAAKVTPASNRRIRRSKRVGARG